MPRTENQTRTNHDTVEFGSPSGDALEMFRSHTPSVRIEFGAVSDVGKVRPINQDHYMVVRRMRARSVLMTNLPADELPYSQDDAFVMVVADGMGGQAFGEIASRLALRSAWDNASEAVSWIMKLDKAKKEEVRQRAEACVKQLNKTLLEQSRLHPQFAGMGTTLTCAYSMGQDLVVVHVGDSRAYCLRDNKIHQITQDHTLAQDLIDSGMAPESTVAFRHLLTNCLGADSDDVTAEVNFLSLQDGDRLLLCTDGLTDLVRDEEIARIVVQGRNPQTSCQELVDLAMSRGGKDNITVLLARYEIPTQADIETAEWVIKSGSSPS
jgi:protein phosphatase